MEKAEYIRQLKQLIRKYHPDLCANAVLEMKYQEITIRLNGILDRLQRRGGEGPAVSAANPDAVRKRCQSGGIVPVKEQDYAYYKIGLKYYRNIHPKRFYRRTSEHTYKTKTSKELAEVLNSIFVSFSAAEYYFKKVVHEYPASPWAADARDKIALLKKLRRSYESFVINENRTNNYSQFADTAGLKIL